MADDNWNEPVRILWRDVKAGEQIQDPAGTEWLDILDNKDQGPMRQIIVTGTPFDGAVSLTMPGHCPVMVRTRK